MQEEKKEAFNKILQLEKQLALKHKMELEIQQIRSNIQVMKHMDDEEDQSLKKKMKEMDDELKEKVEDMEALEELNQTLIVKERRTNDELQEARKELITVGTYLWTNIIQSSTLSVITYSLISYSSSHYLICLCCRA